MKTLKYVCGLLIIFSIGATVGLLTVFDIVEFSLFIFGLDYNEDLLAMGIFTLPMLCYIWWAWTRSWSVNAIRNTFLNID